MAAVKSPELRLQGKHTNRPYGGAWWPNGQDLSHELLDLVARWPSDRPSITGYAFLHDDWDNSGSPVPPRYRTRTLVLALSDRSSCRLLVIPHGTEAVVADEFLTEASNTHSTWTRMDFSSTFRSPAVSR
jgi:hypothetical protein